MITESRENVNIEHCARCGKHHKNVKVKALRVPMIVSKRLQFTHWAVCRTTKEPILVRYIVKHDKNLAPVGKSSR